MRCGCCAGASPRRRWVWACAACIGGCSGIGEPGKPSYLTQAQEQQVVATAATGVFGTAQAVRDWIEAQFGVVYTRDSMYTLLPRLGIRLKVPRPRHTQAAPQA